MSNAVNTSVSRQVLSRQQTVKKCAVNVHQITQTWKQGTDRLSTRTQLTDQPFWEYLTDRQTDTSTLDTVALLQQFHATDSSVTVHSGKRKSTNGTYKLA